MSTQTKLKQYRMVWSLTGVTICTINAKTAEKAMAKVPAPYNKYKGEVYAMEIPPLAHDEVLRVRKAAEQVHYMSWPKSEEYGAALEAYIDAARKLESFL